MRNETKPTYLPAIAILSTFVTVHAAICKVETLNVIQEKSPDQFESVQTVETQKSAKTMAYDNKTKKVFLPATEVETTPASDLAQ